MTERFKSDKKIERTPVERKYQMEIKKKDLESEHLNERHF